MGRVTITFYPNDRKQSNTTEQIPIYLRIRKERLKTEARTDWSVSPNERALWNKTIQRIDLKDCKANDYLNKIEENLMPYAYLNLKSLTIMTYRRSRI